MMWNKNLMLVLVMTLAGVQSVDVHSATDSFCEGATPAEKCESGMRRGEWTTTGLVVVSPFDGSAGQCESEQELEPSPGSALVVPDGVHVEIDHSTTILAGTVLVLGKMTTVDAPSHHEPAASLCIIANEIVVGPAATLCTGAGRNAPSMIGPARAGSVSSADGSAGGDLRIRLSSASGPSAIMVAPGGVMCTGPGGNGAGLFLVDQSIEQNTSTCTATPTGRPVTGVGGDGGNGGLLSISGLPQQTRIRAAADTIRVGSGGDGGAVVHLGNPRGGYFSVGGNGGSSLAMANGGYDLPTALVSALGGAVGGAGGAALGSPCPSIPALDGESPNPAWIRETLCQPIGPLGSACWSSPLVEEPACMPFDGPSIVNPIAPICNAIADFQDCDADLVYCLFVALADVCYAGPGGGLCDDIDELTPGSMPLAGEAGEAVESTPGDGGGGSGGTHGGHADAYDGGASFGLAANGASASYNCGGGTDGEDGKDGQDAGHAGGVGTAGGAGGDGWILGGPGGKAGGVGARGGNGGIGGNGGNAAAGHCLGSPGVAAAGNGGYGGAGGDGSGGSVTGGPGGGAFIQPGKGGDASASGGPGGSGGNGGTGGAPAHACSGGAFYFVQQQGALVPEVPDPTKPRVPELEPNPCPFPNHVIMYEPAGQQGCGGVAGAGNTVTFRGGAGGTSLAAQPLPNGPPGLPLSTTPSAGAQGSPGSPGGGSANNGCVHFLLG